MQSHQKKIIFLLALAVVALGTNILPQGGRVITVKDELHTGKEPLSLISLESRAAVFPSANSADSEMRIGPENNQERTLLKDKKVIEGAFVASITSSEPPFKQMGEVLPPDITATIALVSDLESGTSYLDKGVGRHWPIASITKLMTAVIASQVLSPEARILITAEDFPKERDSTSAYLKAGEEYLVSDLIQMMLIASDNVAAEVLARAYGREKFLLKMNEQAELWGMGKTYYYDPSGLSPVNQSSAEDLEKLAFQLTSEGEDILRISRRPEGRVTEQVSGRQYRVAAINTFAGRSDFLGGKTGFIDEAGGNLFSIFSVRGRPVLIIVFNSVARFEDTARLLSWFKENYQ